jgi:hypothetical protein
VDVARRRQRRARIRLRSGASVRGGPAPRDRHRRTRRRGRRRARLRHGLVRGHRAGRRAHGLDRDGGRLHGDDPPSRLARRQARRRGRGRHERARRGRRGGGGRAAVRLLRGASDARAPGLRRSVLAAAGPACRRARAGSRAGSAGRRSGRRALRANGTGADLRAGDDPGHGVGCRRAGPGGRHGDDDGDDGADSAAGGGELVCRGGRTTCRHAGCRAGGRLVEDTHPSAGVAWGGERRALRGAPGTRQSPCTGGPRPQAFAAWRRCPRPWSSAGDAGGEHLDRRRTLRTRRGRRVRRVLAERRANDGERGAQRPVSVRGRRPRGRRRDGRAARAAVEGGPPAGTMGIGSYHDLPWPSPSGRRSSSRPRGRTQAARGISVTWSGSRSRATSSRGTTG